MCRDDYASLSQVDKQRPKNFNHRGVSTELGSSIYLLAPDFVFSSRVFGEILLKGCIYLSYHKTSLLIGHSHQVLLLLKSVLMI